MTGFWTPQAGIPQPAMPISRQRGQTACWQLSFDQLFTWPTDQPRHATFTRGEPVNTDRPRVVPGPQAIWHAGILSVREQGSIRFHIPRPLNGAAPSVAHRTLDLLSRQIARPFLSVDSERHYRTPLIAPHARPLFENAPALSSDDSVTCDCSIGRVWF